MNKKIVGFSCGSFDLFHGGHVSMLRECKKVCDELIVGIQTDPTIDRSKKNKPIQSIVERQISVGACRYVDKITVYETEKDLEDLLSILDIDIRIVGADWKGKSFTGKEICAKRGIEIHYNTRDHRFSTSELRERIKK